MRVTRLLPACAVLAACATRAIPLQRTYVDPDNRVFDLALTAVGTLDGETLYESRRAGAVTASVPGVLEGPRLVLDIRSRLFDRAQRLSFTYHDATGTADATYRIRYDAEAINYLTVEGAVPLLSAAATVVGMLYVSLRIDLSLAVVALSVVPFRTAVSRMLPPSRPRPLLQPVPQPESSAATGGPGRPANGG